MVTAEQRGFSTAPALRCPLSPSRLCCRGSECLPGRPGPPAARASVWSRQAGSSCKPGLQHGTVHDSLDCAHLLLWLEGSVSGTPGQEQFRVRGAPSAGLAESPGTLRGRENGRKPLCGLRGECAPPAHRGRREWAGVAQSPPSCEGVRAAVHGLETLG
ncbi:unnamed protein product, partial [Rangifer tarandus platyrhynchus]